MSNGNRDVMDTLAGLTDDLGQPSRRCAASGRMW